MKVIHLTGYEVVAKNGKDISDWLKEGHTSTELKQIIEDTEFTISPQKVSTSNAASNINILDYVIKLDKPSDYKPKDGANFILSFEKHRSWFGTDVESLRVKLIDQVDGKRVWEWSAIEENFVELEIESLYSQGKKQKDIAKALNISPATVSRKLKNCTIS